MQKVSRPSRSRSDGPIRLTKVGLWVLIFLGIVGLAAANTGNNGLYLILAFFGGGLVVSLFLAGRNLARLQAHLTAPSEIFAAAPTRLGVQIDPLGRARRWLLIGLDGRDVEPLPQSVKPALMTHLSEANEENEDEMEVVFKRRGRHQLKRLRISSLFPLGLFHKARRCSVDLEVLVYPEILSDVGDERTRGGRSGDDSARQAGWGHELYSMREYRAGDDPRHIHWKQSARTGELVYQQHEREESRRLLIVFDNVTGPLNEDGRLRFERTVSEVATLALHELDQGYEIGLVVRGDFLDFGEGARQRRAALETLALVEPLETTELSLPVPPDRVASVFFGDASNLETLREEAA